MQNVSELLELMKRRGAKNNEKLYSLVGGGFFNSHEPSECPCVALKEMEVLSTTITSLRNDQNPKMIKIVAVIEAFRDSDYYKCLTVGEFRKFLNNVQDKNEPVCIVAPSQIENGWYRSVINAWKLDNDDSSKFNEKMRKITGDNIFHICT